MLNHGGEFDWKQYPVKLGFGTGEDLAPPIHADWPAYPCAPGGLHSLIDLVQFPVGTEFAQLDDIDRCLLLYVRPAPREDPWHDTTYHIALWHEDINWLIEQGYISGAAPATEREWRQHQLNLLREHIRETRRKGGREGPEDEDPLDSLHFRLEDGTYQRANFSSLVEGLDDDPEDEWDYKPFTVIADGHAITVTQAGWNKATELLSEAFVRYSVDDRLAPLLELGYYDTAVREIGVLLEDSLRPLANSSSGYGQRLVPLAVKQINQMRLAPTTYVRSFRGRLRTALQFVRNEFAHKRIDISKAQALALLTHTSLIIREIGMLQERKAETSGD